jgi:hypothetical protein
MNCWEQSYSRTRREILQPSLPHPCVSLFWKSNIGRSPRVADMLLSDRRNAAELFISLSQPVPRSQQDSQLPTLIVPRPSAILILIGNSTAAGFARRHSPPAKPWPDLVHPRLIPGPSTSKSHAPPFDQQFLACHPIRHMCIASRLSKVPLRGQDTVGCFSQGSCSRHSAANPPSCWRIRLLRRRCHRSTNGRARIPSPQMAPL